MKIKVNKNIFVILGIIYMLFCFSKVEANTINKIDMDIYLDKNGNATVTEIWQANLTKGTEGYRAYTNLGYASISDFSVKDDTGRNYTKLSSWNTNGSFNDKAYKCGINNISSGKELCWGISRYGNNTYTLTYNINNFVSQYTDNQGIYFNLLNLKQYVGEARITIHSDVPFSLDNARIWGFGYEGSAIFQNGSIVMDSKGSLSSSDYMVILVRFEKDLFNISKKTSTSFDSIHESAMSGSEYYEKIDEEFNSHGKIENINVAFSILGMIFMTLFSPVTWMIIILIIIIKKKGGNIFSSSSYSTSLNFGPNGKSLPKDSEVNYYRDIPCNKDLDRAYWILYNYDIIPIKTLNSGIIGAILLKWIKENKITVTKTKKGLFSFKDNNYAIDFNDFKFTKNITEYELLEMLREASGSNKILEAKEFEKWCKKKYYKVDGWFNKLQNRAKNKLIEDGLIVEEETQSKNIFGSAKIVKVKRVTDELRNEAINLKGFKKFLLDFSLMPEREFIEVHLWDEYLIFAQLLGIADKVEEQFSKLYPNFNNESLLNTEFTTIAIRNMASIGYSSVVSGRNRASSGGYSGSSPSSGGGGSSSSSGGSSSGGSSGGGFR